MGETQDPLSSLIWSKSAVVTTPVLLASQMVQGWHGEHDGEAMGETHVPLSSLIWSTSAVVATPVLLASEMVHRKSSIVQ